MLPYNKNLKPFSRKLHQDMTEAEQKLWSMIRRKQILGVQFYRQKPIGNFIVDFYCPKAKLIIEADGGQHYEKFHQEQDAARDKTIAYLGIRVLRFSNAEIVDHPESVEEFIFEEVRKII